MFDTLIVNVSEKIINILIVKSIGSVHNHFLLIFDFTLNSPVNFAHLIENWIQYSLPQPRRPDLFFQFICVQNNGATERTLTLML